LQLPVQPVAAIAGRALPARRAAFLPVDAAPVSYFKYKNQKVFILDREDDPVLAYPEPVGRRSGEPGQVTDMLVGILPDPGDGSDDPAGRLGGKTAEVPPGPGGVGDRAGQSSTPNSFRISFSE
jgi:hypothetical protein